jgi:hypothetical protein
MKALVWMGKRNVEVQRVDDPRILRPRDCIVKITSTAMGFPSAGIFGYSHMTGGYAGGQAQYARVPHADVGPIKIENDLPDDKVLFLSDIFPTGYMERRPVTLFRDRVWWRSGAVGRWGSSPSGVRSCWGRPRLLGSTRSPSGGSWRKRRVRSRSTQGWT